jgi:hypothetical protein
MHKTLTNWQARRAGPRITVTGTDENGEKVKITGIDRIEPGTTTAVFAIDKDREVHLLKVA